MKKRNFLSGFLAALIILSSLSTIALAEEQPTKTSSNNPQTTTFTIGWDGYDPSSVPISEDPLFINDTGILTISEATDSDIFKWQNEDDSVVVLEPEATTSPFGIIFSGFGGIFASKDMKITAVGAGSSIISVSDEHGNTVTKEITVIDNLIENIYVSIFPEKTDYKESEIFDPIGMAVKAVYTNGDERFLKNYTYSREPLTAGQTFVTLEHTEKNISKSVDVPITVGVIYKTVLQIPSENGLFAVDKTEGIVGDIVTLEIVPNAGYTTDKIIVNGKPIDGTSFALSDENAVIEVIFKKTSSNFPKSQTNRGNPIPK